MGGVARVSDGYNRGDGGNKGEQHSARYTSGRKGIDSDLGRAARVGEGYNGGDEELVDHDQYLKPPALHLVP